MLNILSIRIVLILQSIHVLGSNTTEKCTWRDGVVSCLGVTPDELSDYLGQQTSGCNDECPQISELEIFNSPSSDPSPLWVTPQSSYFSDLKRLSLTDSHFNKFGPLSGTLLASLDSLDLSGNQLTEIPQGVEQLDRLRYLDLHNNLINSLLDGKGYFGNFSRLQYLDLSFNQLGTIEERNDRRNNPINKGLHTGAFNLEGISGTVQTLKFRNNKIRSFPQQFLKPFPKLRHLDLSYNDISVIPEDAFRGMVQLQLLLLDHNNIRSFYFPHLPRPMKLLSFQDNPLRCDCDMGWLWSLTHQPSPQLTIETPHCVSPPQWKGMMLRDMTETQLCNQNMNSIAFFHVGDSEVNGFPNGALSKVVILAVIPIGSNQMNVTLRVDKELLYSKFRWALVFKQFGINIEHYMISDTSTFSPLDVNSTEYQGTLSNLRPDKGYRICIAIVDGGFYYLYHGNCLEQTSFERDSDGNTEDSFAEESTPPVETLKVDSVTSPIKSNAQFSLLRYTTVNPKFYISQDSIAVEWSIEKSPGEIAHGINRTVGWRISYRLFGRPNVTDKVVKFEEKIIFNTTMVYTITNLVPNTGYVVCFYPLDDVDTTMTLQGQCEELVTDPPGMSASLRNVAVATTVSTSTTAVVVAIVCCICPGCFRSRVKTPDGKKKERWWAKCFGRSDCKSKEVITNCKNKAISHCPPHEFLPRCLGNSQQSTDSDSFESYNSDTMITKACVSSKEAKEILAIHKATMKYVQQENILKTNSVVKTVKPFSPEPVVNRLSVGYSKLEGQQKSPFRVNKDGYYVVSRTQINVPMSTNEPNYLQSWELNDHNPVSNISQNIKSQKSKQSSAHVQETNLELKALSLRKSEPVVGHCERNEDYKHLKRPNQFHSNEKSKFPSPKMSGFDYNVPNKVARSNLNESNLYPPKSKCYYTWNAPVVVHGSKESYDGDSWSSGSKQYDSQHPNYGMRRSMHDLLF